MDYELIRASRRSLSLRIGDDGRLIVRAPRLYPRILIERWIMTKSSWIEKHQLRIENQKEERERHARYYFLLSLAHERGGRSDTEIITLQKKMLREYVEKRIREFREKYMIMREVSGVRIGRARTRWGSCSTRGILSFSIMLHERSLDFIDAVILHELAHLSHMNHGKKFWNLLLSWMPEYKTVMKREAIRGSSL